MKDSQRKAIFANKHTIRFIRQGRIPKKDHEMAFLYEDDPNTIIVTRNPKLKMIKPERFALILGHEKMHHILQKNLGKNTSRQYDNLASSYGAERFLQGYK